MSSQGVTFDTGMLVALERRKASAWEVYRRIQERGAPVGVGAAAATGGAGVAAR